MFITQIQDMIHWIDTEAPRQSKEDVLESIRVKLLVISQEFLAYPHCENFSYMPEPGQGV
jgi:hypothetical protein